MNNEEFDRRMEFILGQRAQFASDIGALKDVVADIEGVVARLANASLSRLEDVDERIAALVDSQVRLTESQAHTDERSEDVDGKIAALVNSQVRLTESQAHTDEKLRNLISAVDRYFNNGNKGRSGK